METLNVTSTGANKAIRSVASTAASTAARTGTFNATGIIATPQGFVQGQITAENGLIVALEGKPVASQSVRDLNLPIIVPGFIDCHVHGAGGADMMDGGDACLTIANKHAQHGTTTLLATTLTAPPESLLHAFKGLREVLAQAPTVLGVHLEGPFINPNKLGAQPAFARAFDSQELSELNKIVPIKLITLAPDLTDAPSIVRDLCKLGYLVQLGHGDASYEQSVQLLEAGAKGFTHLYNAMSPLHHRAPGMVGAALAHAQYAEVIPDLIHVHPGAIRAAMRAIECLYCVTDATSASAMPDGLYQLGTHRVEKCLGAVRLSDGTLAGSCLTMDQAFRNCVDGLQLDLLQASLRTSTYAARFLGLADRGRLALGAKADWVVFNRDLNIQQVIQAGCPWAN
jgi:N-acetylglucosamine-6-phosphate deacetylase